MKSIARYSARIASTLNADFAAQDVDKDGGDKRRIAQGRAEQEIHPVEEWSGPDEV
jgi:hypothetical protein